MLKGLGEAERRKLSSKVPSWDGCEIEVPSSLSFQQCSGETSARFKASLLPAGARVADLTGGLGVDSWAFSLRASRLLYNERDARLRSAVERNFAALGVVNAEFAGFDVGPGSEDWKEALRLFAPDYIYLDPARRDASGRKLFLLEDCSPNVLELMPALLDLAPIVLVKLSPMADITMLRRRLYGFLEALYVVGAEGECKELLCLCSRDAEFGSVILAEDGYVFDSKDVSQQDEGSGRLLFVPSAAMVKSGLGPGLGMRAWSAALRPFGKFYKVLENREFSSSELKALGRLYPQAEVSARGVPVSSEELRKKMRTKPGGPVHIFACPIEGSRRLLVCQKVSGPEELV